jgi:ribosome-associated protein
MSIDRAALEGELEEKFVAASGPGGQHVNKTASAVQLRFNVKRSSLFDDEQKWRIRRALGSRITEDGDIILFAQSQRSQQRNREDARDRLVEMLAKAVHKQKARKATKPSKAAKARRVDSKTMRGDVKKKRGRVSVD